MAKNNKKSVNLTVNKLDIKATNRNNVDIASWRSAHRSAEKGKTVSLYDLYEDIMLDNILDDAIEKRITAITNAELTFTRNDEAVDVIDTIMDTLEFEDILREILNAKFWGITLLELEFLPEKIIGHLIPRKHIRAARKEIAMNQGDETGVPYDEDFFLEVGKPNDLGRILKAAPYVIYKRNNFGDWAQYVEVFGMPIRTAYYDSHDENIRKELVRVFENAGGILTNILPKGSDFKVEPGSTSGDGAIYDRLRAACNEEVLIGILGQTMTTLDGSSRSQGEVHMEVQKGKHKADLRFVQRVLNSKLLPMLEKRGYPVSGGYFYFPEAGEQIPLSERLAIVTQAAKLVPVSAQYVYDTCGIPRPEDGEDVVTAPQAGEFFAEQMPDDEPTNLIARLRGFFVEAPLQGAFNGAALTTIRATNDLPEDNFDTKLIKRVARGEADYFDPALFETFTGQLIAAFEQGWRGQKMSGVVNVGIEYGAANSAVITANESNLYHFAAAKTLAEVQKLNQIYRESKSFDEFYQKASSVCEIFNKTWARTEYETARLTAESAATHQRLKAQTDLFPYWEYRTVGDDQVREEHAALDGIILGASDPMWAKIYPPNGWKCRCRVVPRMKGEVSNTDFSSMKGRVDEYFKTSDWKTAQAQGFDINRAQANEVFSANQMYIRKFPNNAAKYLDKLTAKSWELPSAKKIKQSAGNELATYDGDADQWKKTHTNSSGVIVLADGNGKQFCIADKNFKTHTTGDYARGSNNRVELLNSMSEALKNPDEIWLNAQNGKNSYNNFVYIKYYQGEMIAVNVKVVGGRLEVQSWYRLNDASDRRQRRGLLIKKPQP